MNQQDKREAEAYQNLRTAKQFLEDEAERFAGSHHQLGVAPAKASKREKQVSVLFYSCNGLKCDGICRETHLNRPRFANPKAKKDVGVKKQWAEKCPEAYEQPVDYRT